VTTVTITLVVISGILLLIGAGVFVLICWLEHDQNNRDYPPRKDPPPK